MNPYLDIPYVPGLMTRDSWINRQRDSRGFRKERGLDNVKPRDELEAMARPNTSSGSRPSSTLKNSTSEQQLVQYRDAQPRQRPTTSYTGTRNLTELFSPMRSNQNKDTRYADDEYPPPFEDYRATDQYDDYNNDNGNNATQYATTVTAGVELAKIILTFEGHFYQPRIWDPTSPLGPVQVEDAICRFLRILYYPVNDTIAMFEDKVENAGIISGMFYKRNKLYKVSGEPVLASDLIPGAIIESLGNKVHITDADRFTRDFMSRNYNIRLPPKIPRPAGIVKGNPVVYALGMGTIKPENWAREVPLSENKDIAQRFYHSIPKTYKFHAIDDPHISSTDPDLGVYIDQRTIKFSPSSRARKYLLSYFVFDKNIELRLLRGNDKLDEGMLILKKQKTPKNWKQLQRNKDPIFYEMSDFRCGTVLDIFGRRLLLTSCDEFTKEEYRKQGIIQGNIEVIDEKHPPVVHPIPGFGDGFLAIGKPEETLATVYGQPKVHVDSEKMQRNLNRKLNCRIKIISNNDIDKTRKFMLSYYLENDSIQVFEETVRNSGCGGGTFLKRGMYTNELPPDSDEPRYFKPTDIYLGNVICLNGVTFQITEMDGTSVRFCEAYPDEFPMSDTFRIINILASECVSKKIDIRTMFNLCDPYRNEAEGGFLLKETLIKCLDDLGITDSLNDQELFTLLRRFQVGNMYAYREICDMLSHVYHAQMQYANGGRRMRGDNELQALFLTLRGRTTQWRRVFRKDSHSYKEYITYKLLESLLMKHGVTMTPSLKKFIVEKYAMPLTNPEVKSILSHLNREHPEDAILNKYDRKVKHHPAPSSPLRADIRSSARAENTMHANVEENSLLDRDSTLLYAPEFVSPIKKKREQLCKSVLGREKSRKQKQEMDKIAAKLEQQTKVEQLGDPQKRLLLLDSKNIIIMFNSLCDDIYVNDWL